LVFYDPSPCTNLLMQFSKGQGTIFNFSGSHLFR
jgi:hypothetical protein